MSGRLGGGTSGLGGCRTRRGRPRFLFKGGAEAGMLQADVCILLGLQKLDCLEMLVEVVSEVLMVPMDSTSEARDNTSDLSLLMEVKCSNARGSSERAFLVSWDKS